MQSVRRIVSDEQRRPWAKAARPFGEAHLWAISALLLLAIPLLRQVWHRRRALNWPQIWASKMRNYFPLPVV